MILNKISICIKQFTLIFSLLLLLNNSVRAQTTIDSTKIVRVLTFNIYHGETPNATKPFDLDLLAKFIHDQAPDLVALQEVDLKTKRAQNLDLVTELGQRTKMAPIFGKAMSYDGGEYGEGILSKYSFLTTKNHSIRATEGKEPRAAIEINVVLKSNDTIRFAGTHLDHEDDEIDRINQAKQLNQIFTINDVPTILAGDLNALPKSETMRILLEKWVSISSIEPTYPSDDPKSKIDYILVRPAHRWKVLETKVICNEIVSDHCAVLSVLLLK